MRHALVSAALVCSLTCSAHAQRAAQTIDLRPRFEAGQEIRYEMRTDSQGTYSTDVGKNLDLDLSSRTQQRLDLLLKVLESDPEKGSVVQISVERASIKIESDQVNLSYDTANPKKPASKSSRKPSGDSDLNRLASGLGLTDEKIIEAVDGMVGSVVTIEIDPAGNVTSMNVPPSLPGAGSSAGVGTSGLGGLNSLRAGIGVPFDQLVSVGHPTGLVKPREEWTNEDTIGGSAGLKLSTTHRVRSGTGGLAKVDMRGTITAGSQSVKLKRAKYEGDYQWDTELGQLAAMDVTSEVQLDGGHVESAVKMVCGVRRAR